MKHSVLLWIPIFFVVLLFAANSDPSINVLHNNRTVVFIAGWPQSGTSMIHKFLSMHPKIGTMMEKCQEKHGKRCENWNFEGQWLLSNATLRQLLHSGATCPIHHLDDNFQQSIFEEWTSLWKTTFSIVVEKSPQSLVKTLALRNVFETRGYDVKFLIIIKHPVTINTMTPRKFSWRYERDVVGSSLASLGISHRSRVGRADTIPLKREISLLQMQENMLHFVRILSHNYLNSANCSLGWIDSYEELLDTINNPESGFSRRNLRIVHYESFLQPLTRCIDILSFIFGNDINRSQQQHHSRCARLFSQTAGTNSGTGGASSGRGYHRRLSNSSSVETPASQRSLRLRTSPIVGIDQFSFQHSLISHEGAKRISEFGAVREILGTQNVSQSLVELEALADRIASLGYRLHMLFPSSPTASTSKKIAKKMKQDEINANTNNSSDISNNRQSSAYRLANWIL